MQYRGFKNKRLVFVAAAERYFGVYPGPESDVRAAAV